MAKGRTVNINESAGELDPQLAVAASVWRSWALHASPELLEKFNDQVLETIQGARAQHPAQVHPSSGEYRNMKRDCVNALNRLAEQIQGEYDAEH